MEEHPRSIICPVDGNVNPFDAPSCLKCGLPLAAIREAMAGAIASDGAQPAAVQVDPVQPSPREPAPPLPELPKRSDDEPTARFVDSSRFLIRGMGNRSDEIAARLFKQLSDRGIEGIRLSLGKLIIKIDEERSDSRDYYFAERVFEDEALATMAVRIAAVGTDLFVEWRHHTTPGTRMVYGWGAFWGVAIVVELVAIIIGIATKDGGVAALIIMGFGPMVALALGVWAGESGRHKERMYGLIGFQTQDSTAFQLAVRAALEEAIDLAGISKALIQELPKDEDKNRRVI